MHILTQPLNFRFELNIFMTHFNNLINLYYLYKQYHNPSEI